MGSIRAMVSELHLTVEQAMNVLKIPQNERERYKAALEEKALSPSPQTKVIITQNTLPTTRRRCTQRVRGFCVFRPPWHGIILRHRAWSDLCLFATPNARAPLRERWFAAAGRFHSA